MPPAWEDFAARWGGGAWPRMVTHDSCHAMLMTGDKPFRLITEAKAGQAFYPFDMGNPDPVGSLAGAGFDAPTRAAIEGATATTFLGLA